MSLSYNEIYSDRIRWCPLQNLKFLLVWRGRFRNLVPLFGLSVYLYDLKSHFFLNWVSRLLVFPGLTASLCTTISLISSNLWGSWAIDWHIPWVHSYCLLCSAIILPYGQQNAICWERRSWPETSTMICKNETEEKKLLES